MEGRDEGLKDVGPLFDQGGAVGADDAVVIAASGGAKAARDLLLDLWHAHRLLGQIVGEGHIGLGHETPDLIAVGHQAPDQVGGGALFDSAALARGCCDGVLRLCVRQDGDLSRNPRKFRHPCGR